MKFRSHLYLLYLSTTFWTWFFFGGLWSNYYQDLTFTNALIFVVLFPTIILTVLGKGLLESVTSSNFFRASIISASYLSFLLLFYDFIYLKLHLGNSFNYLVDYWYLTIFSPIPFVILLPIGRHLDRREKLR